MTAKWTIVICFHILEEQSIYELLFGDLIMQECSVPIITYKHLHIALVNGRILAHNYLTTCSKLLNVLGHRELAGLTRPGYHIICTNTSTSWFELWCKNANP